MGYVYAKSTSWLSQAVKTNRGEIWSTDDPLVREHPEAFTDDPEAFGMLRRSAPAPAPAVEETTAVPGEKRSLRAGR
jgi:hypothetical protein